VSDTLIFFVFVNLLSDRNGCCQAALANRMLEKSNQEKLIPNRDQLIIHLTNVIHVTDTDT